MVEEIRLLAMQAARKPDGEAFLRRICRWYSQTFATPLHIVETEIPVEDVLMHFYEHKYDHMEDEERDVEMDEILLTPEERKVKAATEAQAKADDDAFLAATIAEAEAAKVKNPGLKGMDKPLNVERDMPMPLIPVMGTNQPLNESALANKPTALTELPPDIKMEFVEDLGNLDDWDLLGPGEVDPSGKRK